MEFKSNDIVKSCRKLESGLRLGTEGIHACQPGPFSAPIWWTGAEAAKLKITREMIALKRKETFFMLNDGISNISCKQCSMVFDKLYKDVKFTNLGHIDVAADTLCNLRCSYCRYTMQNNFSGAEYDPLTILKEFSSNDVEWDSAVDFNGGEPTLLNNFNEYIDYFNDRRIRIFLYTNAVIYKKKIYDSVVNGSISWVVASLDSGIPSTFFQMKKRDKFLDSLQNLTLYAHAGSHNGGKLAIKYIFTEDNCSDDDIAGFTYAMLAIRPQKVWLTFDFEPLHSIPGDIEDFGGYDYSKHITAYVKTYLMLKQHGLEAGHFTENHLAVVSKAGKLLMEKVKDEIAQADPIDDNIKNQLYLKNFREPNKIVKTIQAAQFTINPFRIKQDGSPENISLKDKHIMIAPTCILSKKLLQTEPFQKSNIVGFLDRDPVIQGKLIDGIAVFGYETIKDKKPDYIFVAANSSIQQDIVNTLSKYHHESNIFTLSNSN